MSNAKNVELEVERHRGELERTLSELRDNLKPSHLVQEALSGGDWFSSFQRFARTSPVSWAIMTAAAVSVGVRTSRRTLR